MTKESRPSGTDKRSGGVTIGTVIGGIHNSIIAGRDVIVQTISGDSDQRALRNRQAMLKLVNDFWVKGVLENSLHGAALIELGLEERQEAVERPWGMVLQTSDQPNRTLPTGTKMAQVFDDLGGSLLILGEPGSGKTTMLLELARDLITRAEQDLTFPIPVVFNLSSWAESRLPLTDWLVEELRTKYNIPKKIAQPWVDDDELLLLLDGLDEVAADRREACVEAINDFRQEHLVPVVVCSRIADYEKLASWLKLQGAVLLQSLTSEQIDVYLDVAGPGLATVRTTLQQDVTLQELAQSPLMLSIMTLAYRGLPTEELPSLNSMATRRTHLFDAYIQRMFERRGASDHYSPQQTIDWLSWLAHKMSQHNLSVFLIEALQPSWLPTWRKRWGYVIGSRAIVGLVLGLVFTALFSQFGTSIWFSFGLMVACLGAGLFVGIRDGLWFWWHELIAAPPKSGFRESTEQVIVAGVVALVGYILFFLLFVLIIPVLIIPVPDLDIDLKIRNLKMLLISMMLVGLAFGLIFGLRKSWEGLVRDIQLVEHVAWSWKRFMLPVTSISVILAGLVFGATHFYYVRGLAPRLWNTMDGSLIAILERNAKEVEWVHFSPDGERFATTTSSDDTVQLWDSSGKLIATLDGIRGFSGENGVVNVFFSPDGTRFETRGEDGSRLWDVEGKLIAAAPHLFSSPDYTRFVTPTEDETAACLWDGDGNLITWLKEGDEGTVVDRAIFSPDGTHFVTTATSKDMAQLWNSNGYLVATLYGHSGNINKVTFSPDGTHLVTYAGEDPARLWNLDGQLVATLEGITEHDPILAFSPDGNRFVNSRTSQLWNKDGQIVATLNGHTGAIHSATFSPDGARLLTTSINDERAILWDSDGRLVATVAGQYDWDHRKQELLEVYPDSREEDYILVLNASFSPDGTRLMTTAQLMIVDLNEEKYSRGLGKEAIWLWNGEGEPIATIEGDLVYVVSIGGIWGGYLLVDFTEDLTDPVQFVTETTDGNTVQLWNWDGQLVATLEGVGPDLGRIIISSDGSRLVTRSDATGIVKLWNVNGGRLLATLELPSSTAFYNQVELSPDGTWLLTYANPVADFRLVSVVIVAFGLILGALIAFQSTIRDTSATPNESTFLSFTNTIIVGLPVTVFAVLLVLAILFVLELALPDEESLLIPLLLVEYLSVPAKLSTESIIPISLIGLTFGIVAALWYGGQDVIRHFILRVILFRNGTTPWNYTRFLDYAAERIFLRKVGGDYIFVHRLLLEHFAKLEPTDSAIPLGEDIMLQELMRSTIANGKKSQTPKGLKSIYNKFIAWTYVYRMLAAYRLMSDQRLRQATIYSCRGIERNPTAALHWNTLCWFGCLSGYAPDVLEAGEQAVKLAPNNGGFRDTRGLARALSGDYDGALKDFKFFAEWLEQDKRLKKHNHNVKIYETRKVWIAELEAGRNPINEATLEELRRSGE